jgi:hypothetical protein
MGKRLTALLGVVWVLQASCGKPSNVAADQHQQPDSQLLPLVQLLQQQRQQQLAVSPVSPILSGDIDSVSDTTIIAYIRKLSFVPDTEAGDRQGLLLGHFPASPRYGPVATILPEVNANRGSLAELRRNGKVIARIEMDKIGAQPYPKLALLPGATTYWWVRLDPRDSSLTGRSVFITVDTLGHIVSRTAFPLKVMPEQGHRFYRNLQPLARFTWNPADEGTWGTCNGACCAKN